MGEFNVVLQRAAAVPLAGVRSPVEGPVVGAGLGHAELATVVLIHDDESHGVLVLQGRAELSF